jgi:hypothetical protein
MYVVMLGGIGIAMARESIQALMLEWRGEQPRRSTKRHHPLMLSILYDRSTVYGNLRS